MSLQLRPFADHDAENVDAILDDVYGYDRRLRALYDGSHGPPLAEPFRRTLVAESGGHVVGAGTLLRSQRHPRRSWIDIVVAPSFHRREIGSALLGGLRGVAERPLIARGRFDDDGAIAFLRHHGFGLLNRSWEGRFDPERVIGSLPEPLRDAPPLPDEAAAFFERWYQETHRWDPPEPWPVERARKLFCGDNLVPESLVGVRADGRLAGAAELIRPFGYDPGDELYLVWIGARDSETACTLLAACARFALDARKEIRFEVDESNSSVWTALDELDLLGEPALGIFADDATPLPHG